VHVHVIIPSESGTGAPALPAADIAGAVLGQESTEVLSNGSECAGEDTQLDSVVVGQIPC